MNKSKKNLAVKVIIAALSIAIVFGFSQMSAARSLAADGQQAAHAAPGQITSTDIAAMAGDAAEAEKDVEEAKIAVAAAKKAYDDAKALADDLAVKAIDAGKAATDATTWFKQQNADEDGDGIADDEESAGDASVPEITEEMVTSYCDAATKAADDRNDAFLDVEDKLAAWNAAKADLEAKELIANEKYNTASLEETVKSDADAASSEDAAENDIDATSTNDTEAKDAEEDEESAVTEEPEEVEAAAETAEEDKESAVTEEPEEVTADTAEEDKESAVTEEPEEVTADTAEEDNELEELEAKYGMDDYDRDLLAALVFYEANTEPENGKVAVASVVLNRIQSSGYPNTLQGVIYQRSQFTPARLCAGMARTESAPQSCYDAVDAALEGERPVGDALHFMRKELHGGTVIRNHAFW